MQTTFLAWLIVVFLLYSSLSTADDGGDFDWSPAVWGNLSALYLTYLSGSYGYFVIGGSTAFIQQEFSSPREVALSSWLGAAPAVVQCVFCLFIGELSDMFGRRWFLAAGNILVLAALFLGAFSPTIEGLIAGQVVMGLATSLTLLSGPSIAEAIPKKDRAIALSATNGFAAILLSFGQVIQGAFQKAGNPGVRGWRNGMYVNIGIGAAALVLTFFCYKPGRRRSEGSSRARLALIPWPSIAIGAFGVALFLVGLQQGGTYGWTSARILCFLIIGGLALIGLGLLEWRVIRIGLFPAALFENRNFAVTLVVQFMEGMAINTTSSFLPVIGLQLFTTDPVLVTVRNLPFGAFALVGAMVAGLVMRKLREAKGVALVAVSALLLACGLMCLVEPHINYAAWFFPTAMIGAAVTTLGVTVNLVSSVCTPNELIAHVLSLCTAARGLGGAVGNIVFFAIYNAKVAHFLPSGVSAAVIQANLSSADTPAFLAAFLGSDPSSAARVPGASSAVLEAAAAAVPKAYADSWRFAWYSLMPFAAVTMGFLLLLKPIKHLLTDEVASAFQSQGKQEKEKGEDRTNV